MILGPLSEEQQRNVFRRCLASAVDDGLPCRTDTGLSPLVEQAISAVAQARPAEQPAAVEAAEKAFQTSLSDPERVRT